MSSSAQTTAFVIGAGQFLIDRMVSDLSGTDWLHRPCPKANCAAWIVGHLILSDRRLLPQLGVTDLPQLPDGFEQRFARDESAPFSDDYGDTSILVSLFDQHRKMLGDAAAGMKPEDFDKPLAKPHPRFRSIGEMAAFMGLHAATHAGHISTIRRSLGRAALI